MLSTEFSTDAVPARERFGAWVDLCRRIPAPACVAGDAGEGFRASLRVLALEDVVVSVLDHSSLSVRRTPRHIRAGDPEAYQFWLVLRGSPVLRQSDRETVLRPGQGALLGTSVPYERESRAASPTSSVAVQVPRSRMPLPPAGADRLTAVPIDARHGLGAAFARWLTGLVGRAHEITPADEPALAQATVDLLGALLAGQAHSEAALGPEARQRALRARIITFTERHLGDPLLSPRTVAQAHHISLRQLHRLLAADDVTPAAWIRRRRLERCRQELADRRLAHLTVGGIAARWGFTSSAHFTRAFRAAYGTTPSEYRNRSPR